MRTRFRHPLENRLPQTQVSIVIPWNFKIRVLRQPLRLNLPYVGKNTPARSALLEMSPECLPIFMADFASGGQSR
jgi:hypothetical protein